MMWVEISRTSAWNEKPCDGAVEFTHEDVKGGEYTVWYLEVDSLAEIANRFDNIVVSSNPTLGPPKEGIDVAYEVEIYDDYRE